MKNINILFLALVLFIFTGCNEKKDDIKIGFVAGLSGKYSSLGTSVRDGFLLKFYEIDNNINGHKIKIVQKDDKQNENEARKIINYFIKSNIKLVVGNTISSMTEVSYKQVNKQKNMLLISATASSGVFTKQDDNFLRIQVDHTSKKYLNLVEYLLKNDYKNIFMIYDSKNMSYVKGYKDIFQNYFVKHGGNKFVGTIDINEDYNKIIKKVKASKSDLILIVANSIDSANMIQYLRFNKIDSKILASGWAKTKDFITNGGKNVEGVMFSTAYNDNYTGVKFLSFVEKYKKKYGKTPSVFAAQGYELASILVESLEQSSDLNTLKDRILERSKFEGLQGKIVFDKYGDINRDYFLMEVRNKKYIKID